GGRARVTRSDGAPGPGHPGGDHPELAGHGLLQPLHEHLPLVEDADAGRFQGPAGGRPVPEQEVGDAATAHHPGPAALDAHAGAPQPLAHPPQRPGAGPPGAGPVRHHEVPLRSPGRHSGSPAGSHRTSVRTELAMKHCSCASRCMASISARDGRRSPPTVTAGRRVTTVMAHLPASSLVSSPTASSRYSSITTPRWAAMLRNHSMWQLASAATNASSGSTAAGTDIGTGTTCGEEEAGTSTPPSNSQRWPRE